MPTSIHHFTDKVTPERFDAYLTDGWRSTGQAMYRSDFLRTEDDEVYGCVQLRLPLTEHRFTARQRKLMNRNARQFTYRIEPARWPDPEMRAVNRKYLREKPDNSREDLEYHVFNERGDMVLDTYAVKVFDADRLVGFSYFDVGKRTLYSKTGIYDPRYRRASLGIYTMLLEVEFARARGVAYYHPGYISRGYPMFHYKADLGPMEYRDVLRQTWLPLGPERARAPITDPYDFLVAELTELRGILAPTGVSLEVLEYPSFTARYSGTPGGGQFLDGAVIGLVDYQWNDRPRVVNYNFEQGQWQYLLAEYAQLYDMKVEPRSKRGRPRQTQIIKHDRPLLSAPTVAELADGIRQHRTRPLTGY